jgi:hypothetical protein
MSADYADIADALLHPEHQDEAVYRITLRYAVQRAIFCPRRTTTGWSASTRVTCPTTCRQDARSGPDPALSCRWHCSRPTHPGKVKQSRSMFDRPELNEAELAAALGSFRGPGVVLVDDAELLRTRRGCLTAPSTIPEGDLIGVRLSRDVLGQPPRPGRCLLHTGDGKLITVSVPAL